MPGVTGILFALIAQAAASLPPASNADFPLYDRPAWALQRRGLTAHAAERSLRRAPDAIETLELLLAADRADEALRTLRRIVDRRPGQMAKAFEMVSRTPGGSLHDEGRDHEAVLQEIVDAAFLELPALPREEAARAERQLLMVDARPLPGNSFVARLEQFVAKYRGTETATLTELEILTRQHRKEHLEAVDGFIRAHPEGSLAAQALYKKGRFLSGNPVVGEGDPTRRLMEVVDIARDLQSGRYPASEWVDQVPRLITGFGWYQPTFSPLNLPLVLEVFYSALKETAGTFAPSDYGGPEDMVTRRFAELFEYSGDGVAGVERLLDRFELDTGDRAMADYLRAVLSLSRLASRGYSYHGRLVAITDRERTDRVERAMQRLDALSRGNNRYTRRALAMLATFHFEQGDFARARARYVEFLKRFPAGDYAWVAALRVGQCAEAVGDAAGAVEAYRAATARRGAGPLSKVMGRVAAGRLFESQERPDVALREYRRALASWDNDYGRELNLVPYGDPAGDRATALDQHVSVTQLWLRQRIDRLTKAAKSPAAARLERARWLLEQRRFADARIAFEGVVADYPRSPQVHAARYGAHVARLQQALTLLQGDRGSVVALRELQDISTDPYDFIVPASKIARASLLWVQGATADADALMREALSQWQNQQRGRAVAAATALDHDVLEIRRLIFQPARTLPYLIVSSEVDVTLADGEQVLVSNAAPLPGLDVLFLDHDQRALLTSIARVFPSAEANPPERPMYRLLEWWHTYFESGPSGWGQIHVETHPYIWSVEFTNVERTRATARISTGPSRGRALVLEKVRGAWQVVRAGRESIA